MLNARAGLVLFPSGCGFSAFAPMFTPLWGRTFTQTYPDQYHPIPNICTVMLIFANMFYSHLSVFGHFPTSSEYIDLNGTLRWIDITWYNTFHQGFKQLGWWSKLFKLQRSGMVWPSRWMPFFHQPFGLESNVRRWWRGEGQSTKRYGCWWSTFGPVTSILLMGVPQDWRDRSSAVTSGDFYLIFSK